MGVENLVGLVDSVQLAKVEIRHAQTYEQLDSNEFQRFEVLFNPSEYSLDKDQQISEVAIPGLDAPLLQYVHGRTRTLSMQLLIDTTEPRQKDGQEVTDASVFVDQITGLMQIDGDTHAPPICQVRWQNLKFTGVLASARARYLLFNYKGIPLRATVDVTFREYRPVSIQLRDPQRASPDRTKVRLLKEGETLAAVAAAEYKDPGQWREIARRNGITDPRRIPPGTRLIIPPITQ